MSPRADPFWLDFGCCVHNADGLCMITLDREGWEYATSFDAPPDQWTNEPPTELRRLMEQPGLGMSGSTKWVRRRRWVRVMRRRLDRPSLPFADLDGPLAISQTGNAALLSSSASNDASSSSHHQQQQPAAEADYVARARYTAGVGHRLGARAEPSEQSSGEGGSLRSGKTATTRSQGDVAAGKAEARRLILRLEVSPSFSQLKSICLRLMSALAERDHRASARSALR